MKKLLVLIAILLILVTACTPRAGLKVKASKISVSRISQTAIQLSLPGPNPELNKRTKDGQVAGVIQGFWHGIIAPVTAVGAFFNPDMQMYEVHNNGQEYNLGFLIGVALIFLVLGVIGGSARRR